MFKRNVSVKPDFTIAFFLKKKVWKPGASKRPIIYNMATSAER